MRNSGSLTFGISLVMIGTVIFLNTIHIINLSWNLIWPIFILGFGIMLHLQFMIGSKKNSEILVPAGIFTTYGLLFYICILLGWHMMNFLWPLFIMGPAVGLLEMYLFGKHEKALLIPVSILSIIGFSFLTMNLTKYGYNYILSLILIFCGTLIMIMNLKKDHT